MDSRLMPEDHRIIRSLPRHRIGGPYDHGESGD
jgi:hypothetical protein